MLAEPGSRTPLAIVGIGCRFPGGADTPEDYWRLLCGETDATRTVPESRWSAQRYHDPNPAKVGKMVTRRGGFLCEIDQFDPQFFGISPREANLLDPQQRLLLRTTWEALEDGGIPAESLAGTEVGVFVGGFTLDYQLLQNQGRTSRYRFKTHSATGMMMTMLANRISFAFDFRGPSMTIDTACSSSLVAVHLAALSIWNGECDVALAGGVNVMIGPNTAIAESKSGFLSPDGRCKAFDESADGYARGEGGAMVVIKPLEAALRNGDEIYAQILGSAVSQDGHTDAITVPSAEAQEAAIRAALRHAGVPAEEVGYVEAHGTGTPVGDPVEVRALANALALQRPAANPLLIGSVKTNIGHLEAGAGVAGLIKTALVLKSGYIPATLHLTKPSPRIPLSEWGIDIPRSGRPFPVGKRRVAGVNSFGFGGTNAHVVLAEPPATTGVTGPQDWRKLPTAVLPISARTEEALVATARRLAEHLDANPGLRLLDLGYTLSQRRSQLNCRTTLVVDGVADAHEQLRAIADSGRVVAKRTAAPAPALAFVCTGMGPQWWKMCRGLLDVYPAFTESIRRSDRELSKYVGWSLIEELLTDETRSRMGETDVAQPANFAIQVALAEQLKQFGVYPDAVVGHSAGEVAAHYLAGVLTFEQAVHLIYQRSRLQQRTSGLGHMLAVGLSAESFTQIVDARTRDDEDRRLSVAAINGPSSITLAGDSEVLEDVARQLEVEGIFHRYLTGKVPYHSHFMDAVKDDLNSVLEQLSPGAATIPLYSTVTGERLARYADGAAYWWQNTRATVLFEPAVRRMLDDGYTHFVELGPHPVLASSLLDIAATQHTDCVVVAAQRRNDDDGRTLMHCVGTLHCHGHPIAWEALYPPGEGRRLKLPLYPWQSKRFWNETQEAAEDLHYNPVHPLLGQPVSGIHPAWEVELNTATTPLLADHRVQGSTVLPGAVYIEMALAAAKVTYGTVDYSVDQLTFRRALILDDTCDPVLRTTLNRDAGTVEFAALTATAGGDVKWTITATAELNTLARSSVPALGPTGTPPQTATDGDEFYARARAAGFDYGDAFQTITRITSGEGWATAHLAPPTALGEELDEYRFHPVLIDGAFQTLIGTAALGREADDSPHLPVRIRRSAIYAAPQHDMTAHVRVVSTTSDEVESDIVITGDDGQTLAVFTGFTLQALSNSSHLSPERIDKGLYEIHWVAQRGVPDERPATASPPERLSWLILVDAGGVGTSLAEQLRRSGQQVRKVLRRPVPALAKVDGGYALNPRQPEQLRQLLDTHLATDGSLTGIIDCWPLDICAEPRRGAVADTADTNDDVGVFTILNLVKAVTEHGVFQPRLYLITANAQPAPGTEALNVHQAAIWGLGRVIGHQEFAGQWGGLIDIDDADGGVGSAARICEHILTDDPEDQIAIRDHTTFVPRVRSSSILTQAFPTKLSPDATYVVTGGAGALGRVVALYLAERGARHIALLVRSQIPPRAQWSSLPADHRHRPTVDMIGKVERLGARVSTASVDITRADQVEKWLSGHLGEGGRPVRGIIHAAGTVDDRLLVNMTEADFAAVMAPKVDGARVLHEAFRDHELEFFVMFGSAGSVVTAPGQGNYAAANAFLDAFAHYRQAQGLPALTIGWGPWSAGMVEELKLEEIYAQRGIELITPAAGTRILDRLINQKAPNVIAIGADWGRVLRVGFGRELPPMFSELRTAEIDSETVDSESSMVEFLSRCPEADRLDVVARQVRNIVAAVFELAVDDIAPDDALDDIGLDSMMAMDFRLRISGAFGMDIPLLELLRGVSVNSLAVRILNELCLTAAQPPEDSGDRPGSAEADDAVDRLLEQSSEAELRELLAELEGQPIEQDTREMRA
ncbi:type I polyketide synthase [Mycobacterium parmense]|uniref:Mycocerosic acid synthase n=1 Tax=Mycobacterium parmense TaxID=185642 RepID=A0A7I7YR45_9MYCO|nr:type I polyketide synthase [Mycobacterium parmense]MCV7348795.1 type I polyketide synthase [Mycobacterium parmense]ORW49661.1 polyketide synthase [Mycobacterium parmense]BBZ44305.1 mycocerosic acid synthase [Mycobacterium parmense]